MYIFFDFFDKVYLLSIYFFQIYFFSNFFKNIYNNIFLVYTKVTI